MTQMTPEEALQIIDSACGSLQINRESHVKLQQAIAVLGQAIAAPKEPDDGE